MGQTPAVISWGNLVQSPDAARVLVAIHACIPHPKSEEMLRPSLLLTIATGQVSLLSSPLPIYLSVSLSISIMLTTTTTTTSTTTTIITTSTTNVSGHWSDHRPIVTPGSILPQASCLFHPFGYIHNNIYVLPLMYAMRFFFRHCTATNIPRLRACLWNDK